MKDLDYSENINKKTLDDGKAFSAHDKQNQYCENDCYLMWSSDSI